MTLSLKLRASQTRSWNSPMRLYFSLSLVPESVVRTAQNLQFLLDVSGSMNLVDVNVNQIDPSLIAGYGVEDGREVVYLKDSVGRRRIEVALEAVQRVLGELDPSSRVSLITFSDDVRILCRDAPPATASEYLSEVEAEGDTSLYKALSTALELTNRNTDKIFVITDGYPTDVEDPEEYRRLKFPPFVQVIPIGVGEYNASILSALAELTNGRYYHINNMADVLKTLQAEVNALVGAKEVMIRGKSELPITLVNYGGFPISLGTLEGVTKVMGYVEVPPGFSGRVLSVEVEYLDPSDRRRKTEEVSWGLHPAKSQEEFRQGLDPSVVAEVNYYEKLREMLSLLDSGMQVEATRKLKELEETAEKTRRQDLIEETRSLRGKGQRELTSELTKRLRS